MGATTTDTESCQALFCALADFVSAKNVNNILNLEKYPTFWHFTGYTENGAKGYNKVLKECYAIERKKKTLAEHMKDDKGKVKKFDSKWFGKIYPSDKLREKVNEQRKKKSSQISKKDWENNNKYLKDVYPKYTIVNTSGLPKMKKVLDEEVAWYVSSVKIAKTMLEELTSIDRDFKIKGAGCQMAYYRGEKENPIMGTIGELFKKANIVDGSKVLGDINKWSPADMYFASPEVAGQLAKMNNKSDESLTFVTLNDKITRLILDGKLLPLSLKKVKDDVHLVKVNFHKSTKQAILDSVKYKDVTQPVSPISGGGFTMMPFKDEDGRKAYTTGGKDGFKWKAAKGKVGPVYPRSKTGSKTYYRDIYVNFETTERHIGAKSRSKQGVSFQFRHTPASGGKLLKTLKCLLHYEGLNAISAGQVTTVEGLCALIKEGGDEPFAKELLKTFNAGHAKFLTDAGLYLDAQGTRLNNNDYPDYLSKNGLTKWGSFEGKLSKREQKTIYLEDLGAISAMTLMNDVRTTIDEYFKKSGNEKAEAKKRNVLMAIYQYTSSRSKHSARFVIAK